MPARLGDEHTEFAGASTVAGAVDQQDAPDIALSGEDGVPPPANVSACGVTSRAGREG